MANLAGASLSRAGLRRANLYEMNLIGAKADSRTQWPEASTRGRQESFSLMNLNLKSGPSRTVNP
jgi:uncharacterized protein YjbI with pentapeptide repeats